MTTKSSPSEKNWKKLHFKGPGQRHLGYVQLWKERIDKMPFYGVKLPKLQAVWTGYGRILPLEK